MSLINDVCERHPEAVELTENPNVFAEHEDSLAHWRRLVGRARTERSDTVQEVFEDSELLRLVLLAYDREDWRWPRRLAALILIVDASPDWFGDFLDTAVIELIEYGHEMPRKDALLLSASLLHTAAEQTPDALAVIQTLVIGSLLLSPCLLTTDSTVKLRDIFDSTARTKTIAHMRGMLATRAIEESVRQCIDTP